MEIDSGIVPRRFVQFAWVSHFFQFFDPTDIKDPGDLDSCTVRIGRD